MPEPTPANLFTPLKLNRTTLPHRILRAATFENMADENGIPTEKFRDCFCQLARGGAGTIITGFTYTSLEGRAMQPFQAGIDHMDKIAPWARIVSAVRQTESSTRMFMQISHTGRQTLAAVTGQPVVGASRLPCTYFRQRVRPLSEMEVEARAEEYIAAARRAEDAGFDGVEVHAAHGYLIHQFLSPWTNRRRDRFGKDRFLFLRMILEGILTETNLAVLVKLDGDEDWRPGVTPRLARSYARRTAALGVDAIEVSYGTMELAFNIIRGEYPLETVLKHNRLFKNWPGWLKQIFRGIGFDLLFRPRLLDYRPLYNLDNARQIARDVDIPVFVTGGVRNREQAEFALRSGLAGISVCRPFVAEPDFVQCLQDSNLHQSSCTSCNLCTVMSDSHHTLRCYGKKRQ